MNDDLVGLIPCIRRRLSSVSRIERQLILLRCTFLESQKDSFPMSPTDTVGASDENDGINGSTGRYSSL